MPKNNIRRKAQLGLDIREGGIAIPIAPNMYYMNGRSHDEGGIGIGPNNKNGLEVEGGEVVKVGDKDIKVFSSVPLLRGVSPAQLVMGGANPNKVFKAQEEFKDRNRINDDGTHYEVGGEKKIYEMPFAQRVQYARTGKITNTGYPVTPLQKGYSALRALGRFRTAIKDRPWRLDEAFNSAIKGAMNDAAKTPVGWDKQYNNKGLQFIKALYNRIVGNKGQNLGITKYETEDKQMKAGGIYIKPSKHGTFTAAAKKRGMGVQEFASKVLANKEDYSPAMVKKANFARNASRWKKELGGSSNYYSIMEKVAKDNYKRWGFNNEDEALMHALNDNTYDYRGYYNKYPNSLANADTHWTDEFKTVYHPTFSIESKYSGNKSIYNPLGLEGGYWDGDDFVPAKWQKSKKEYGGNMIYTINGNVKNGLMSARPKAQLGRQRKVEGYGNTIIVGDDTFMLNEDGIYVPVGNVQINKQPKTVRGASGRRDIAYDRQGNRYQRRSDGSLIRVSPEKGNIAVSNTIGEVEVNAPDVTKTRSRKQINTATKASNPKNNPPRQKIEPNFEIGDQTVVNFLRNGNGRYNTQRTPIHSFTPAQKLGLSSYGWSTYNDPNKGYTFREDVAAVKAGEKSVDEIIGQDLSQINFDNNQSSSAPRKEGTKPTSSRTAAKSTPTLQDTVNQITRDEIYRSNTPKIDLSRVNMPTFDVSQLGSKETKAAKTKVSTSPTGGQKEAPWIPQFNTISTGDWIGLGSNLAGHIASYFANNSLLKKAPMPTKPVMTQAAKLKTRYNINPELSETRETELVNRAASRRNSQSSNTSLAREQRIANESRNARNKLYGQKENIETQLINQDRLNRQSVMARNVAAYNDWLNKTYVAKSNQMLAKQQNLMSLISGIPAAVGNFLGNIDSRKATNNTIKAIAVANPNVDGRMFGIGDYYSQKLSDGRVAIYDKNGKLKKYV